jgi:hypothetical protein
MFKCVTPKRLRLMLARSKS